MKIAAAAFGVLSAICWFVASLLNVRTGFDMDRELAHDLKIISRWNAVAAFLSGVAVVLAVFA